MSEKLQKFIDELNDIFNKSSERFPLKNYQGEEMPQVDYFRIPRDRVEDDLRLMKDVLRQGKKELESDEFYVLIAVYCNFYIGRGLNVIISDENFGLGCYLSACDDTDVVYCIIQGIKTQDYSWFESVYEINNECTVAKVYLFVRGMADLAYAIATGQHIPNEMEKNVWKYYEGLDDYWKEYVIQEKEKYPFMDEEPLPYICCNSYNKHIIQTLNLYMNNILEDLGIDINDIEPDALSYTISNALNSKSKTVGINANLIYGRLGKNLLSSNEDLREGTKFEILPYPNSNTFPVERYSFLHIPVVPYETIGKDNILARYRNFVFNRELTEKQEEIEKLNNEKMEMMDYYAHSWKHISYPKIVKDVAEALLGREDDDSITMANKLLRAYNSEQTLKHGIQLLQYSISSKREMVRNKFGEGFFVIGLAKEEGLIGIDTILNESLDMVILRLMMTDIDTSRKMKKCRKRIENIDELREEYTEYFLKTKKRGDELLKWVNNNIFNLEFDISEEWKEINIVQESFAAAQITEIVVELLTNILRHGNGNAKIELKTGENSMDLIASNDCDINKIGKNGKGLRTLSRVIKKINFDSNISEGVKELQEENRFTVQISLNKRLMYKS